MPGLSSMSDGSNSPLPGHQAGAPLRQHRPGGVVRRQQHLSPAIRPGLRCGVSTQGPPTVFTDALPGHQAGAPLRPLATAQPGRSLPASPRPSGRGSVAAGTLSEPYDARPSSPRPSGRGSVAAGCHAGASRGRPTSPRPSGRGSVAADIWEPITDRSNPLPGHQAGAPLRQQITVQIFPGVGRLSPAIRPGLRCGVFTHTNATPR